MGATPQFTRHALVLRWLQLNCYAAVAKEYGVDSRTVARWVSRYQHHGNVDVKKPSGRPRELSVEAARAAKDLLLGDDYTDCHSVAKKLHSDGLTTRAVHPTTLARRVKAQAKLDQDAVKWGSGVPRKALTDQDKARRLRFARANLRKNWALVMVTDRKRFPFRYPGVRVRRKRWQREGETQESEQSNHPPQVNLYAGLTTYGVTDAHFITGTTGIRTRFHNERGRLARSITIEEYRTVLSQTLLPGGQRLFSANGHSSWTLQQDNDPTHKRAALQEIEVWNGRLRSRVQLIRNWPPSSPDLSPIENAWALVQDRVDALGCENFAEYEREVRRTWRNLPQKYCKTLMRSMRSRLQACIEARGGKTRY